MLPGLAPAGELVEQACVLKSQFLCGVFEGRQDVQALLIVSLLIAELC